jgi:hypothetical protein
MYCLIFGVAVVLFIYLFVPIDWQGLKARKFALRYLELELYPLLILCVGLASIALGSVELHAGKEIVGNLLLWQWQFQ